MRYTLSFVALVVVATAKFNYHDLPACSLPSIEKATTDAGCPIGEGRCVCERIDEIAPAAQPDIITACPVLADQDKVVEVMRDVCGITEVPGGFPPGEVETEAQYSASSCPTIVITSSVLSGYIPRPASSDAYGAPPIATEICSPGSPVVTITTTRVVSLVTHSPSSLLTVSGTAYLSSLSLNQPYPTEEPSQAYGSGTSDLEAPYWPTTSVTGGVELSEWMPPQASYGASTVSFESGIAAPYEPYPSALTSTVSSPTGSIGSASSSIASEVSSIAAPLIPYPSAISASAESASPSLSSSIYATGSYTSQLPEFTNAAEAVRVPAVVAGVVGMAAWIL